MPARRLCARTTTACRTELAGTRAHQELDERYLRKKDKPGSHIFTTMFPVVARSEEMHRDVVILCSKHLIFARVPTTIRLNGGTCIFAREGDFSLRVP